MNTNSGKESTLDLYGNLYEKYAPGLLFYARKFVSQQVAEDVVHDVFFNMWRKSDTHVINESVVSYMFQSVQNGCINYLKRENIRNEYIDQTVFSLKMEELTTTCIEKKIIDQEQIDAIYQAIDSLPEKNKEVFQLSYLNGKKNAEISKQLNISIRTVENHLYKALQELRKQLLFILLFIF